MRVDASVDDVADRGSTPLASTIRRGEAPTGGFPRRMVSWACRRASRRAFLACVRRTLPQLRFPPASVPRSFCLHPKMLWRYLLPWPNRRPQRAGPSSSGRPRFETYRQAPPRHGCM